MKRLVGLAVVISVALFGASARAHNFHDCQEPIKYGAPSERGELLCRIGFALAYNAQRKIPDWTAERLTREKVFRALPSNGDTYAADPTLKSGKRAELTDYKDSGYEPGTMTPPKNLSGNPRAEREAYYLSNTAPQIGSGMKYGIWKLLEENVRTWATQRFDLYVFTGPVFVSSAPGKTVGKGKVSVPDAFFKVVFDPVHIEAIAFVIPNQSESKNDLASYRVTVDEVEAMTGLDFLSEVQPAVQEIVESDKKSEFWH